MEPAGGGCFDGLRIFFLLFADDVMFFSSMSLVIELGVRGIVAFLCARNNNMSISGEFAFYLRSHYCMSITVFFQVGSTLSSRALWCVWEDSTACHEYRDAPVVCSEGFTVNSRFVFSN